VRRRRILVEELIALCEQRGIGRDALREHVHGLCTYSQLPGSHQYLHRTKMSDDVYDSGIAAQISFLLDGWNEWKLRRMLNNTGGILDAIVRSTSSSRDELKKEVNRGILDKDGRTI